MKTIRITFPCLVHVPSPWLSLIAALRRQLPCESREAWNMPMDSAGTLGLDIELEKPIKELPIGWEAILDAALMQLCLLYEQQHPTRVMWPSGSGDQLIWDEPREPTRNAEVFEMTVSEREDYYGRNPNNPDRDRLQKEQMRHKQARMIPKPRGSSRVADAPKCIMLTFDRELTDDEMRRLHDGRR